MIEKKNIWRKSKNIKLLQGESSGRSTPSSDSAPGKLFVGGLSWQTNQERLREYFGQFGTVTDVLVMKDPITQVAAASRVTCGVTRPKIEYCEFSEGCGRLVFICARQNFPRESFATFYFSAASVIKSKICASHKIFSPSEIFLSGSECRRCWRWCGVCCC